MAVSRAVSAIADTVMGVGLRVCAVLHTAVLVVGMSVVRTVPSVADSVVGVL